MFILDIQLIHPLETESNSVIGQSKLSRARVFIQNLQTF